MRSALVKIGVIALLFILGCAPTGDRIASIDEYERGSQQAVRDMLRGRYRFLVNHPITRYRTDDLRAELKRQYGIQHEISISQSSDYVRGYNFVMDVGIKEKFGDDYHEKAWQAVFPESQTLKQLLDHSKQ